MENPFFEIERKLVDLETLMIDVLEAVKRRQPSEPETNLGTVSWFSGVTHKKKNTVYSELCNGKIPKNLIHKPAGTKRVLFYKDRVLAWLESGCVESNEGRA
jgi:hypothetical protein